MLNGSCVLYHCATGTPTVITTQPASACAAECAAGEKEDEFTANEEGCDFKTKTRTCCSDNTWSAWDEDCPCSGAECCTAGQCWNGYMCADQPKRNYNGKCYYTCNNWQCKTGTGWTCDSKDRIYEEGKKTQKGTWTAWNDQEFSSKPSSTCSNRAVDYLSPSGYSPSDDLAITICNKHINGLQGTPDGTSTWSGSCTIYGNVWCVNYDGSVIGDGNAYCSTGRYKVQTRTVQCTEEQVACE